MKKFYWMKNLAILKGAGPPGEVGPTVISTLELRPDLLSFSGTKLSDCPRRFVRVALKKTRSRSCSDGVCAESTSSTAACCKIDSSCELISFVSLVSGIYFEGHWCDRELAAMIIHSNGCGRWSSGGGTYEEARQV